MYGRHIMDCKCTGHRSTFAITEYILYILLSPLLYNKLMMHHYQTKRIQSSIKPVPVNTRSSTQYSTSQILSKEAPNRHHHSVKCLKKHNTLQIQYCAQVQEWTNTISKAL